MYFARKTDMNLGGPGAKCYGLKKSVPQNAYVDMIMPSVMVLEGGALRR